MNEAATHEELEEYLDLERTIEADEIAKDYPRFVRESWHVIEPANVFAHNWHIDCIGEYLTAVRLSQIQKLIINIQPRSMKSTLVSIDFPVWWWCSEPSERFLFTSYGDGLVKDHSEKRRAIIESDWYQQRWGMSSRLAENKRVILASDQNEKKEFMNTLRGRMVAAPIGGALTGKGGGVIIIDDPQNPDEADSDVKRLQAQAYVEGTLMTRLDDKKIGRMVIVMQRLHEKDLTGHELAKGDWVLLCLPAEFEKKTVIDFPISKRAIVKEAGGLLWPEREPKSVLDKLKIGMTEQRFVSQYNQKPSPTSGNILKREWWRRYTRATLPTVFDLVVDSWDMTFKKESSAKAKTRKEPDYVVGTKWGIRGADAYLLRLIRERMSFTEARDATLEMALTEPYPAAVLIEAAANGEAVIDSLRKIISGLRAISPKGDKVERANAASPVLKAGNIFIPDDALLLAEENALRVIGHNVDVDERTLLAACIEEASVFDKGENDDFVDSTTQFINWFVEHGGGMLAWVERRSREIEEKAVEQKKQSQSSVVATTATSNKVRVPSAAEGNAMTFADLMGGD